MTSRLARSFGPVLTLLICDVELVKVLFVHICRIVIRVSLSVNISYTGIMRGWIVVLVTLVPHNIVVLWLSNSRTQQHQPKQKNWPLANQVDSIPVGDDEVVLVESYI
jgi:hypothetical protein